jgi:hypothetical protein
MNMTTIDSTQTITRTQTQDAPPEGDVYRPESNSSLLPQADIASLGSDPAAALTALIVTTASTQKHIQREMRKVAEKAERVADDQEINAMNSKADDVRSAGVYRGLGQMLGGASTAAGGFGDSGGAKGLQASAQTTQGAFSIVAGGFDSDAVADDANAKVAGEASSRAKSTVQDTKDATEDASKLLEKALDFYKEYTSTKDQTTAIASRRA